MFNDLRYGVRMLAANPGFTAVAIVSLALGIGATTSMFSLADAMLLRPLPVDRPSEMVRVSSESKADPMGALSYPDFVDLRQQSKTLSGLVGFHSFLLAVNTDPAVPAQMKIGLAVDTGYFDVLHVRPALGRAFRPEEHRAPVLMLADWYWQSAFAGDRSVIGRTVRVSNIDFTIIGVAPKSFPGLDRYVHEAGYVPLGALARIATDGKDPLEQRDHLMLGAYGRLADGHTAAEAQSELQGIAHNLEQAYPDTNRGRGVLALPELTARARKDPDDALQTSILLVIAGLALLIACANVASLLLARARARSREIAIRLAIGAGRARLFRQLLTESLLLGCAGGAAGLLLAYWSINYFASIRLPTDLPLWLVAHLDMRVLLFTVVMSLASGVIFGVVPTWQTLKTDLSGTLKSGDSALSGKRTRFQLRNVLVIGQVAASLTLLVISGVLIKDFGNLLRFRPGFRTDHILVMMLDPSLIRYQEPQTRAFYKQLVTRVEALPGVRSVALGQHVPLGFTSSNSKVVVEGFEMPRGQSSLVIGTNTVDEHYFSTMQIPVAAGRAFETRDTAASPRVAIVNETMARTYWPKRSPLGGRIQVGKDSMEVVGVVKDIKYRDVSEHATPFVYLPYAQQHGDSLMVLHVETQGDPASLAQPVLAQIRALDPAQPIQEVQTLQNFFEEGALFGERLIMRIVTGIGLFGMLLAITGLYGAIAYSVSRRTREIGIRMAIGANPLQVARLILRQGMRMTGIGIALGLVLALAVSQLVQSLLVGVSARDPWVYLAVPLALGTISLVACYIPARRAARVDPLEALRHD